MSKTPDPKPKKKGLFAMLKESLMRTSSGCGPGCGCHAEKPTDKPKSSTPIQDDSKK